MAPLAPLDPLLGTPPNQDLGTPAGQVTLAQVMPGAVCLLRFPTGELPCVYE